MEETELTPEYVWNIIKPKTLKENVDVEKLYYYTITQTDALSYNNLGCMYHNGLYIEKNFNKAIEYYTKAIELGNINAINLLGNLYYSINEDDKALEYYTKGVDLGNSKSMINLSTLYKSIVKQHFKYEKYEEALIILIKLQKLKHKYNDIERLIAICIEKTKKLENIYNDVNTDICPCCFETLKNTNSYIIIVLCGHSFHYNCIKKCDKCPVCRCDIIL